VFPVEDGIRKWRHDEVRADMQDEYSEGVVDKKVEDAEYQKRLERGDSETDGERRMDGRYKAGSIHPSFR
jgi:hypothetical protein